MRSRRNPDNVENVATGGPTFGEFGNVGKRQNQKSTVMNGVNVGKVGTWENFKTDEGRKDQDEEKLRKAIIKDLARRNREKHAIMALMSSPKKNCRGMKCAKFVNKN